MVTGMFSAKIYHMEQQEILVLDGTQGFLPGMAAIQRICSRGLGVGLDRVILFTGTEQHPSFRAYTTDGVETELTSADMRVLARSQYDIEVRFTNYFIGVLRELDAAAEEQATA
ncbi:MAG: diaminopimelate epimerase [Selenomonadaceae bacterium]|nr:diaminopimelate epimerase [Selenomonadaceae bacterium]